MVKALGETPLIGTDTTSAACKSVAVVRLIDAAEVAFGLLCGWSRSPESEAGARFPRR